MRYFCVMGVLAVLVHWVAGCDSAGQSHVEARGYDGGGEMVAAEPFREAKALGVPATPAVGRLAMATSGSAGEVAGVNVPAAEAGRTDRLMVYNAVLMMVVQQVDASLNAMEAAAHELGGYMQQRTGDSITLKVPADRFRALIGKLEELGQVTRRDIQGRDVTEEMRDLQIRLANAEQLRERLLSLLDRAEKVEDALKIETELGRLTEQIELLKGKIAYLEHSVAYSTVTVRVNSPLPQGDLTRLVPFPWVRGLTSEMSRPAPPRPKKGGWLSRSLLDPPSGYLRFYQDTWATEAMSPAVVYIKGYRVENYAGGDMDFWLTLVRRVLTEQKVVALSEEGEQALGKGKEAKLLIGSKQIGTVGMGYMAALATTTKHVYVVEAWGPAEAFAGDLAKLKDSVGTVRVE